MSTQNLTFIAFLFLDTATIARNTLQLIWFRQFINPFTKNSGVHCLILHCRLDSIIVFQPLASQIVLKRSKHVKI